MVPLRRGAGTFRRHDGWRSMPVRRPLSGPLSLRLAAVSLAAIAGFSFYSGVSRQGAAAPRGGRSGQVVVIQPQPQIVAWQQGYDRSFGPAIAVADPVRRHRRAQSDQPATSPLASPVTAATEAGQNAVAHEAAPTPVAPPVAGEPPASPPADAPPT